MKPLTSTNRAELKQFAGIPFRYRVVLDQLANLIRMSLFKMKNKLTWLDLKPSISL